MTPPGLSGVLMTQLTWGADAWDAARAEAEGGGEARAADWDKAKTVATDLHGEQQGLVGTAKPPAVAMLGELDQVSDDTAGPGIGAESWGDTAAADALEGGREEGASGDRPGGSRRMTFTEVCMYVCVCMHTFAIHRKTATPCVPGRDMTSMTLIRSREQTTTDF